MSAKTVGGNIIDMEPPKKPGPPMFDSFVRKPDDAAAPTAATRLIPRTATEQ